MRRKLHHPFNLLKEIKHATAATQKILVKYRNEHHTLIPYRKFCLVCEASNSRQNRNIMPCKRKAYKHLGTEEGVFNPLNTELNPICQ